MEISFVPKQHLESMVTLSEVAVETISGLPETIGGLKHESLHGLSRTASSSFAHEFALTVSYLVKL